MGGYTRLYRRLWDKAVFRNKQEAAVFAWMISAAQWREGRISTKFGPVELGVGELLIAERTLAEDFGMHRNTLRTLLHRLVDDHAIERFEDRCPHRAGTVVKIVNYKKYQAISDGDEDSEDRSETVNGTEEGPKKDRRRTKNKEGNEDNTSSEANASSDFPHAPPEADGLEKLFGEWWQSYPRYRRGAKGPAQKKWLSIVRRRKAKPDELLAGLERYNAAGYAESQFAMGAEVWLNREQWTVERFPPPGDSAGRAPPGDLSPKQQGAADSEDLLAELRRSRHGHDGQPELGRASEHGGPVGHGTVALLPGPAGGNAGDGQGRDAGTRPAEDATADFLERAWAGGRS